MDLKPDLDINSQEALAFAAARRQEHEAAQAHAPAAQGGEPQHVPVPWTDRLYAQHYNQMNENKRTQQRRAFLLSDDLLGLIFVSLADFTQDLRNTFKSLPRNVLHNKDRS